MNATTAVTNAQSTLMRRLAFGGIVAPVIFFAIIFIAGAIDDEYSPLSQKISELGGEGAQYPLLQNANFVVVGLLVIGFAWALTRYLGGSLWGPLLIGGFGLLALIGNGVLPCDIGCEGETTMGRLHQMAGLSGFAAALTGMFLLARRWRADPEWRSHATFTWAAAALAIAGFVGWFATEELAPEVVGVFQRIFAAGLMIWVAGTAVRLYRSLPSGVSPRLT